jgi:hypothetical protein
LKRKFVCLLFKWIGLGWDVLLLFFFLSEEETRTETKHNKLCIQLFLLWRHFFFHSLFCVCLYVLCVATFHVGEGRGVGECNSIAFNRAWSRSWGLCVCVSFLSFLMRTIRAFARLHPSFTYLPLPDGWWTCPAWEKRHMLCPPVWRFFFSYLLI